MSFMDGSQKKMKLSRKFITHPPFASFFVCEIKKKIVANNKKLLNSCNWHSGCPNYQMTAFVFFILMSAREGKVWFEGVSTWLIHYTQKKQKTQTATQLYC
jgi:hypothetical protein